MAAELRSAWQAETCPTTCTRRSLMP